MGSLLATVRGGEVDRSVRRKRRVLVVEDEPSVRYTIATYLRDAGYAVAEAADGSQALERMRAALPDVVILDLQMPTMGGSEFLARMRSDPRQASVSVLLLSADPGLTEAAARLGARGALAKPFDLDILLAVVDQVSQT